MHTVESVREAGRSRGPARVQHEDNRPTGRQIYKITRLLCDVAGLEFPETRAAASTMIETIGEQLAAIVATENGGKTNAGF